MKNNSWNYDYFIANHIQWRHMLNRVSSGRQLTMCCFFFCRFLSGSINAIRRENRQCIDTLSLVMSCPSNFIRKEFIWKFKSSLVGLVPTQWNRSVDVKCRDRCLWRYLFIYKIYVYFLTYQFTFWFIIVPITSPRVEYFPLATFNRWNTMNKFSSWEKTKLID